MKKVVIIRVEGEDVITEIKVCDTCMKRMDINDTTFSPQDTEIANYLIKYGLRTYAKDRCIDCTNKIYVFMNSLKRIKENEK